MYVNNNRDTQHTQVQVGAPNPDKPYPHTDPKATPSALTPDPVDAQWRLQCDTRAASQAPSTATGCRPIAAAPAPGSPPPISHRGGRAVISSLGFIDPAPRGLAPPSSPACAPRPPPFVSQQSALPGVGLEGEEVRPKQARKLGPGVAVTTFEVWVGTNWLGPDRRGRQAWEAEAQGLSCTVVRKGSPGMEELMTIPPVFLAYSLGKLRPRERQQRRDVASL